MMRLHFSKLHIFTQHGSTYTFLNGEILTFNESSLVFLYEAESDGCMKQANFWVKQICGYSLVEKSNGGGQ